jgi:hypothetical protein
MWLWRGGQVLRTALVKPAMNDGGNTWPEPTPAGRGQCPAQLCRVPTGCDPTQKPQSEQDMSALIIARLTPHDDQRRRLDRARSSGTGAGRGANHGLSGRELDRPTAEQCG